MSVENTGHLELDAARTSSETSIGPNRAKVNHASQAPSPVFDLTIHGFYHAVLQQLSTTTRALKSLSSLPESDVSLSERCLNLLFVWAHGIDLRSLETSVSKETGLQEIVAELLADIARILVSSMNCVPLA